MGTLIERFQAFTRRYPFRVWRGLQHWSGTPDSDLVWAWYADMCGVFESTESLDPIEIAKTEGRREAFFILRDMCTADGRTILEVQESIVDQSGG